MCLKFTLAPPLILKCKIETFLVESRFFMSGHECERRGPARTGGPCPWCDTTRQRPHFISGCVLCFYIRLYWQKESSPIEESLYRFVQKITTRGGWCATGWLVRSGGGMRMRAAACATRHTPSGAARCTRTCELLPSGPAEGWERP